MSGVWGVGHVVLDVGCEEWGAGYGMLGVGGVWGVWNGLQGMGCWVWGVRNGVQGMGC